jgi:hypothetical protein
MLMKDMIRPSPASPEKEERAKEMPGKTMDEKSDPHKHYLSAYLQTGQITCRDVRGGMIDCTGSGQDGDLRSGGSSTTGMFEPD